MWCGSNAGHQGDGDMQSLLRESEPSIYFRGEAVSQALGSVCEEVCERVSAREKGSSGKPSK